MQCRPADFDEEGKALIAAGKKAPRGRSSQLASSDNPLSRLPNCCYLRCQSASCSRWGRLIDNTKNPAALAAQPVGAEDIPQEAWGQCKQIDTHVRVVCIASSS